MIKIEIADAGKLSQNEATALGHFFMQLAGHSLHAASEPMQVPMCAATYADKDHRDILLPDSSLACEKSYVDSHEMTIPDFMAAPPMVIPPPPIPVPSAPMPIPPPPMPFNIVPTVLDSNGIPWDARIHARNKSQTPSGVWKLGRNLPSDYVKQVLAELRGVPMPPEVVQQETPFTIPVPPPQIFPSPTAPLVASELYENLLNKVTTGMGNGKLTIATVNNILKNIKDQNGVSLVSNLAALGTFSDDLKLALIPNIITDLDKVMA